MSALQALAPSTPQRRPMLRPPAAVSHAWQVLHPPLPAHAQGWLDVGDGHQIYWEQAGHPLAPAVLVLHGGPGAGCRSEDRRWFDPQRWRIVLFDQRGCGRSRPSCSLIGNHTEALIDDIETLRRHLGISRWLLFGGSWGSTLALAYAERHPERVSGLVLRGVYTASAAEQAWLYGPDGAARRLPQAREAWQVLCSTAGTPDGAGLLDALHARLARVGLAAARAWWQWEQALMQHEGGDSAPPPGDAKLLEHACIGVHYARRNAFLAEGQLLTQAHRLHGIPGVIVQGRLDQVTPPATAQALARAWPSARLRLLAHAGHASSHPAMAQALVEAVERF